MVRRMTGRATKRVWVTVLLAGVSSMGCERQASDRRAVSVYAATSTAEVLAELADLFETQQGIAVHLNLAASSVLARQIEAGAPSDVFISANLRWMDHLERAGWIEADSRRELAGNRLVLIAPNQQTFDVRMTPGFDLSKAFAGRLAVGDPDHVPAGLYARQALQALGWWDALADRLVPCMDVRAALRLVETEQAPAGVIYATDAASSSKVTIIGEIPSQYHAAIRYPVARCKGSGPEAEAFLEFLNGDAARQVWAKHGFTGS